MVWGFQMSYFSSLLLNELQICDMTKLEVRKKSDILDSRQILLSKSELAWLNLDRHNSTFFGPWTLTGHNCATPWTMEMKSSSYSLAALLTSVRTSWKVPIYQNQLIRVPRDWSSMHLRKFNNLLLQGVWTLSDKSNFDVIVSKNLQKFTINVFLWSQMMRNLP